MNKGVDKMIIVLLIVSGVILIIASLLAIAWNN